MHKYLDISDKVKFSCHKEITCLNKCCRDVNIFLTPYDIIRLKNILGINSQDFLDKYTLSPFSKEQKIPIIVLKLKGKNKACPFAGKEGCEVYADRPGACRMYPVTENSHDIYNKTKKPFQLIKDKFCLGHKENRTISISDYLHEQGVGKYNEMLEYFNKIISHKNIIDGTALNEQKIGMFYMACYNIDTFRKFIFESSFLNRFVIGEEEIESIKNDDIELMKFGFKWLQFILFRENFFKLKEDKN